MILNDLTEIKLILEMDPNNNTEDAKLMLFIEWASSWIETFLNRKLFKKQRTEYYKGTGTEKLPLKARPVFVDPLFVDPIIQVYIDEGGFFGSVTGSFSSGTMLTYGTDYCLDIDQDDGSSRSGLLYRINSLWPKRWVRTRGLLSPYLATDLGSIKVVYTAGYTIDTLPSEIRQATVALVTAMRYLFPLGVPLTSESYEDRSISQTVEKNKEAIFSQAKPLLFPFRNWKW